MIHCFAGISRSATITIAVLMKNRALTLKEVRLLIYLRTEEKEAEGLTGARDRRT